MIDPQIGAVVAVAFSVVVLAVKREFNRVMTAVDRIPPAETFREWGLKLDVFDPARIERHYAMVHDHANIIGKHELRLDLHERRLLNLEAYTGEERRGRVRE